MSEEAFKALPLCTKISILSRQVCKACSNNKLIPICFIGFGITKLYNILFSNFWLLFIASFIPTGQVKDEEAAKLIYSNVMIVSVVLGLLVVPIAGRLADKYNP